MIIHLWFFTKIKYSNQLYNANLNYNLLFILITWQLPNTEYRLPYTFLYLIPFLFHFTDYRLPYFTFPFIVHELLEFSQKIFIVFYIFLSDFRLPITDYWLPITDCRLRTGNWHLPYAFSTFQLLITEYRLPILLMSCPLSLYPFIPSFSFPFIVNELLEFSRIIIQS